MALYTADDYDLNEVGIPITGMAAFAPLAAGNVIADEDMGKPDITFPAAYRRLGLYKEDGGAEEGRDDKDATEFFQQGYKFPGESTQTVKIGLAEDNPNVNALIDGKEPDANGVVYVDSSLPSSCCSWPRATRTDASCAVSASPASRRSRSTRRSAAASRPSP